MTTNLNRRVRRAQERALRGKTHQGERYRLVWDLVPQHLRERASEMVERPAADRAQVDAVTRHRWPALSRLIDDFEASLPRADTPNDAPIWYLLQPPTPSPEALAEADMVLATLTEDGDAEALALVAAHVARHLSMSVRRLRTLEEGASA